MRTTSKLREALYATFLATVALACVGFILAHLIGDQTPPYEPSLANELVWDAALICSWLAVALGLFLLAHLIRDATRR